jgi:hypothetical protein
MAVRRLQLARVRHPPAKARLGDEARASIAGIEFTRAGESGPVTRLRSGRSRRGGRSLNRPVARRRTFRSQLYRGARDLGNLEAAREGVRQATAGGSYAGGCISRPTGSRGSSCGGWGCRAPQGKEGPPRSTSLVSRGEGWGSPSRTRRPTPTALLMVCAA